MTNTLLTIPRDDLLGVLRRLKPIIRRGDTAFNGIALLADELTPVATWMASRRDMTAIEQMTVVEGRFELAPEPIAFFFDAETLSQAASQLGEQLSILRGTRAYILTDGASRLTLQVRDARNLPEFDLASYIPLVSASAPDVVRALTRVLTMVEGTNDIQGAIQTWIVDGRWYFQSVNRFRGTVRAWVAVDMDTPPFEAILWHESVRALMETMRRAEQCTLMVSERYANIGIQADRTAILSATLSIPPMRLDQIFETPAPGEMTLSAEALATANRFVLAYFAQFPQIDTPRVELTPGQDTVMVTSAGAGESDGARTEIAASIRGSCPPVILNATYLREALQSLTGSVTLHVHERMPARLLAPEQPNVIQCIMPMSRP